VTGRVAFCIPIYEDWPSAVVLLERLDVVAREEGWDADVLLVDDGSNSGPGEAMRQRFSSLGRVDVLHLRRNLGHQRAIAIGLTWLHEQARYERIVVMDGDGEDAPEDVPRLLERLDALPTDRVVFAARTRRSEGLTFRLMYRAYRALHRVLTGRKVEVGNFSALPAALLARLVAVSELWNHYAAAVYHARLPTELVPIARGTRIDGSSRMSFVSLATHGLSAMSVFGETIGVRMLVASSVLIAASLAGLVALLALGLDPGTPLPSWSVLGAGLLVVLISNALLLSAGFVFIVLRGRDGARFLPLRDYQYFVREVSNLSGAQEESAERSEPARG
jgi:hypothetical protein